jgi:hypothetical protein
METGGSSHTVSAMTRKTLKEPKYFFFGGGITIREIFAFREGGGPETREKQKKMTACTGTAKGEVRRLGQCVSLINQLQVRPDDGVQRYAQLFWQMPWRLRKRSADVFRRQ